MTLDQIDTSRFLVDPKNRSFVKNIQSLSKIFDFNIDGVSAKKALVFLVLMYDKESYFRKEISDYMKRRYEAGICAKFVLHDDRFDSKVEDLMLGENMDFNRAVVQYTATQSGMEYAKFCVYEYNFYKLLADAYKSFDKKGEREKTINSLEEEINNLVVKLFGSEEVMNLRNALYEGAAISRLKRRPEDIIEKLEDGSIADFSPYGDYDLRRASEVNFVGDSIPNK